MLVAHGFFIMLKKNALYTLTLLYCTSIYANVPIESRGLSSNDTAAGYSAAMSTSNDSTSSIPTNINWQLTQKTQELEKEIRTLRGKIEEQDNEIGQLKNELTNRYTDLDQRLELIMQKVDPDSATTPTEDNQQDISPSPTSSNSTAININSSAKKTATASSNSTTSAPIPPKSTELTHSVTTNEGLEKAAYTVALEAYKQGGAKKAIAPMQNFIKNHPNSVYTSNAYFWLAEFNLALEPTNYTEAKKNFEIVMTKYPHSAKAPSAIYRLYSIALNVDHNANLATKYKSDLLNKYPKSEEASFIKK